jgi:hypothetical protein
MLRQQAECNQRPREEATSSSRRRHRKSASLIMQQQQQDQACDRQARACIRGIYSIYSSSSR